MCYIASNKRGTIKTIILALSLFCSTAFAATAPHVYYLHDEGGENIPVFACSATLDCAPVAEVSSSDLDNFLNHLSNSHRSAKSRILSGNLGIVSFATLLFLGYSEFKSSRPGVLGLSQWGNLGLFALSGVLYAISAKNLYDAKIQQHYYLLERQVNSGLVGGGVHGERYNRIFLEHFAEFLEEYGRPMP